MSLPRHDSPNYGLARRTIAMRWLRAPWDYLDACGRVDELNERTRTVEEIVHAALDLGSHGMFEVKASQVPSEISGLAHRVEALRPSVIVEIGVYKGGTGLIWSHLASDLVVLCDLRNLWLERSLLQRFPAHGHPRLEILCGNSHETAFKSRLVKTLDGRPIDFLFIDGDHSLAGIRQDFADYSPLVRPGGLIACHDIVPQQPFPETQVPTFWAELKAEGKYQVEEFVEDWNQVGYGIGVVQVR